MLNEQKYDIALLEAPFYEDLEIGEFLPMVLHTDDAEINTPQNIVIISKYQRISVMLGEVLENYAKESKHPYESHAKKANITAVWSPVGGVGKTTVALALAATQASKDKKVIYINFEPFSGTPVYFDTSDKSISILFEMLEAKEGNLEALIQSVLCKDSASGIAYFCCPDNFDDMNILTVENISALLRACSGLAQELVIDMSCVCDERSRLIFGLADRILLVLNRTSAAKVKMEQFMNRHTIFSEIKEKICVIANKGAILGALPVREIISLPIVESMDETRVYKVLSSSLSAFS
jgi:septum formation inhibitor-activating ATPase MinD